MQGGNASLPAFEELASLLLTLTVLHPSSHVRLAYGQKGRNTAALGGPAGPDDPILLKDGRYLRLSVSLYVDHADPRGPYLKVSKSSYQYQEDPAGKRWICRYDYLREPGSDPHPTAHLQIDGTLHAPGALGKSTPLRRIHFPTGRISLEAVIRLLADQFHVPTNKPPEIWRRALAESEPPFLDVALRPMSGPARVGAALAAVHRGPPRPLIGVWPSLGHLLEVLSDEPVPVGLTDSAKLPELRRWQLT